MLEYCKCGSLIINGQCSKKNCAFSNKNKDLKAGTSVSARKKAASSPKSTEKKPNPRKASKCITYNLYTTNVEEKSDTERIQSLD